MKVREIEAALAAATKLVFIVAHVIYEKDGFAIVETTRGDKVLGSFRPLQQRCYAGTGSWETSKFGKQFKLTAAHATDFPSARDLARFLALQVDGIGKGSMENLVADVGDELEALLDNNELDRITDSIGRKRALLLLEAWPKLKPSADMISPLLGYGLSPKLAEEMIADYGKDAIKIVEEDPYSLIDRADGVGFLTADSIARRTGIAPTSPKRLNAAFNYAMLEATRSGHLGIPRETLLKDMMLLVNPSKLEEGKRVPTGVIEVPATLLVSHLDKLLANPEGNPQLKLEAAEDEKGRMAIWYRPLLAAESVIAGWISKARAPSNPDLVSKIDSFAASIGFKLAPEQRQAVTYALSYPVTVITGGPGCGKSATLKVVLGLLNSKLVGAVGYHDDEKLKRARGAQGAPTGKAAKRIAESTGMPAQTLHSLFGIQPGRMVGTYDRANPAPYEYLVIDEASMADTALMAAVLLGLKPTCLLIVVGDVDQLPSVGPGQVLRDLIRSGVVPVVRLVKVFRQGAGSGIIEAATEIREGRVPESTADGQFVFVETEEPAVALQETVAKLMADGVNMDSVQVLSPFHKGAAGCTALNQVLQQLLNPLPAGAGKGQVLRRESGDIRVNDRVIQNRNNGEVGLVNGDIGNIIDISMDVTKLLLADGKLKELPHDHTKHLSLAYAITIHKSQGAEAPIILIALDPAKTFMLSRALIYTGVTRAAMKCIVFGSYRGLQLAVRKGEPPEGSRRTLLAKLLRELMPQFSEVKPVLAEPPLEDLPF